MLKDILASSSQDEPDFLFGSSSPPAQSGETHFHFAFMFSAPLVTCYTENENIKFTPIKVEVDYRGESDAVKKILSSSTNPIMFKPFVATQKGLSDCLSMKPKALHFCGHGVKNDKNGGFFIGSKDIEGDCLVFEDGEGKADFKSAGQIATLLQQNRQEHALDFVFVASCHSSIVGEVFRKAGAKHVICVDREEKILDEACIKFTESFYRRYFTGQFSVCESFEFAKQYIKSSSGLPAGEENKFVLLIKEESLMRFHSCTFQGIKGCMSDIDEPFFKDLTPLPRFHHVPARVEGFIGRHRELHEVIKEIQNQRLVIVQGVHGVGKSSLCREAANYLAERNVFEDGVIYLKVGGCDSIEGLLSKLDVELGHISKQIDSIEVNLISKFVINIFL